jgi:hypothetical protein
MKLVEYKKHIVGGVLVKPDWIHYGEYLKENNTFLGYVLDEEDREYYVPDTVTELSFQDLFDRVRRVNPSWNDHEKEAYAQKIWRLIDQSVFDTWHATIPKGEEA